MVRLAAQLDARMIFVSTSGTVGCFDRADVWADERAPYCRDTVADWPYCTSKIAAERQARQLARLEGVDLTIVRPPILWGPGDHRFRSTGILLALLKGQLPAMPDGKVDFVDVRDVARLLVQLGAVETSRPIYHTPGTSCRISELFDMVEQISPMAAPTTAIPAWVLWSGCEVGRRWGEAIPGWSSLPDPVYIEMAAHCWDSRSIYVQPDFGWNARPARQTLVDAFHWLRGVRPELDEPWRATAGLASRDPGFRQRG